jgi:hypothetical protein
MLIGLTVYATMRGPDLVSALANEFFQVLIHVRGSRLSDVWSALDLSALLTKDKCAGSDVAEIGARDQRGLTHLERVAAEIVAVQLNQVESVERKS